MVTVSVIIPVYNRAAVVGATLESLAAQTTRDFEVILVDNNSTDDSLAALHRWRDSMADSCLSIRVLECATPGASAARNMGLAAAKGRWTMFFDSDDTMRPGHIARVINIIESEPEAALIGWNVCYHEGAKASVKTFTPKGIERHNIFEASMATQRYAVLTSLARRAGGWNESVMRWNDIEYGQRILAQNPVTVFAGKEITVDVIVGDESITGTSFARDAERLNHSLDCIKASAPESLGPVVELKRAITAGLCAREDRRVGREMYDRAVKAATSRRQRLVYSLAYHYTAIGGRGAARFTLGMV